MDKPWKYEEDYYEFTVADLKCLILRNSLGVLCGYVEVSVNHPHYADDYRSYDIDVHGGLTFSGERRGVKCVGFDCGHLWDYVPHESMEWLNDVAAVYRDVGYVKAECVRVAQQLTAQIPQKGTQEVA